MSKILGLVLELNPFHNGHYYFIQEAKRKVNPDYTICVISTNFSMRGDLSVIDKFTKTKLAIDSGIDLVLELPFLSAVNSADYFAYNAIKILTDLNISDLSFGVELDNLEKLFEMKKIIDSEDFQTKIKNYLSLGFSYATSSLKAISEITLDDEIINNFSLPNNTLGIQYLRSIDLLKKNVDVTLIKRINNQYYDNDTNGPISSATSIRNLLKGNETIDHYVPLLTKEVKYIDQNVSYDNLLKYLKYQFITHEKDYFTHILGVNEGIENRMESFLIQSSSYEDFIKNVQTKRYTNNKIKRLILHILLNSNKKYENQYISYLRMLGANSKGLEYINQLPKSLKIKIITTIKNKLDDELVLKEFQATKLYGLITNNPDLYLEEFKIPFIQGGK